MKNRRFGVMGVLLLVVFGMATGSDLRAKKPVDVEGGAAVGDLNVLEERFMKGFLIALEGVAKSRGKAVPRGGFKKVAAGVLQKYRRDGVFVLADADKERLKNNVRVKGFEKQLAFWDSTREKIEGANQPVGLQMLVICRYFSTFTADSDVADQLLMSRIGKTMRASLVASAKTMEIMKVRQVYTLALQAKVLNEHWVKYADLKVKDSMKFRDPESGVLMDWVMRVDAGGNPEQAFIVSPKPSNGFYIIAMKDGASTAVPLKEAKEKYGVGE